MDCLPVILALRKGSHSPQLQPDAEAVNLGALEPGAKLSFLHVPGTETIAARTDGASRDVAKRVVGPSCTMVGRDRIRGFLHQHSWEATIDLFAADCNKFVARYASWTDDPSSEAVDAFSLASWNQVDLHLRSRAPKDCVHLHTQRPGEGSIPASTVRRRQSNFHSPHGCHCRLLEGPEGTIDGTAGANLSTSRIPQSAGHHGVSYGFPGRLRRNRLSAGAVLRAGGLPSWSTSTAQSSGAGRAQPDEGRASKTR